MPSDIFVKSADAKPEREDVNYVHWKSLAQKYADAHKFISTYRVGIMNPGRRPERIVSNN